MKRSEARRHVRSLQLMRLVEEIRDPAERAQYDHLLIMLPSGSWKPVTRLDADDEREVWKELLRYLHSVRDRRILRRYEAEFSAGGEQ